MNSYDILQKLSQKGVKLWAEGEQLRIKAPKGVITTEERADLAKFKLDIIDLLKKRNQKQELSDVPLISVSRNQSIPLSFEQERLWLVNKIYQNGLASHNIVQAISLEGKLNIPVLEQSLEEIVQRHECLHTVFVEIDGNPTQKIRSFSSKLLSLENCENLTSLEQEKTIQEIADRESIQPFELVAGPLFRFVLVRQSEIKHILLFVYHHIIGDVLSSSIMMKEVAECYQCLNSGLPISLVDLTVQYPDFAVWQRNLLKGEKLKIQKNFWQDYLAEAPTLLNLPTDFPREKQTLDKQGSHFGFCLSSRIWSEVKKISQKQGRTASTVLLTAFAILLYKYSSQEDIVIGLPTSGRINPQLEKLIGFFAYPLPIRFKFSDTITIQDLIQQTQNGLFEIQNHQITPLSKVIEVVHPERSKSHSPLFQVIFSTFLGKQLNSITVDDLTFTPLPEVGRAPTDLDLLWSMYEVNGELYGTIAYNELLFKLETIEELVKSYEQILSQWVESSTDKLTEFNLTPSLEEKVKRIKDESSLPKHPLVITATFTAEPVTDFLNYWLETLKLPYEIEFAPYNQVFQELLDPQSLVNNNSTGINIILVRFEDWLRYEDSTTTNLLLQDELTLEVRNKLSRNVEDLISFLKSSSTNSSVPYFLCLCPATPDSETQPQTKHFLEEMENLLLSEVETMKDVYVITSLELVNTYPVNNFYDAKGDELGHIPFTPLFYSSMGTILARKISALKRSPYKVIVLDCDNTLWRGVCGEDGVSGITIDPNFKLLQEFVLRQSEKGMLLCLCSKNNEDDVREVFTLRNDMVLQWENLVSWKINWQPKSANLKSLAQELDLGLNSFILIDDNPVECEEVKANCPQVLTLQLPKKAENIPQFLEHIWAFDKLKVTEEDQKRASFYQQNVQRQEVMKKSLTLTDFIQSLNLKVEIEPINSSELGRASQLTQRTNQFNATTIRRSESEIQSLIDTNNYSCLTVKAKDRFGDYGLVGLMIAEEQKSEKMMKVDTFLLSCRTLGRGVEHQMLAEVGRITKQKELDWVMVNYKQSQKNQPILNFLESVGSQFKHRITDGYAFQFPTDYTAGITYSSQSQEELATKAKKSAETNALVKTESDLWQRIATNLAQPEAIFDAIQDYLKDNSSVSEASKDRDNLVLPSTEIEKVLSEIWAELLHTEKISVNGNFFELGGDSILIIQVVARANKKGLHLTPMQIYEYQTISELAPFVSLSTSSTIEQGLVTGKVPLIPIQHWFFEQKFPEPHHFNMSFLLEVEVGLKPNFVAKILKKLVEHHDALRLKFVHSEAGWQQEYGEAPEEVPWEVVNLTQVPGEKQEKIIEHTANKLQSSLNLSDGILVKAALFQMGNSKSDRLLIVVHHLVIDGVSWRIFLEDFVSAYQQLEKEQEIELPAKTASFKDWAELLGKYSQSAELIDELNYWTANSSQQFKSLPSDYSFSPEENILQESNTIETVLTEEETKKLLKKVSSAYSTRTDEVLLTALLKTFAQWTNEAKLLVDLEGHGRENLGEEINVSRTIGWFTTIFPVLLELNKSDDWGEMLKFVKEQLRKIPKAGIGYGILRYLSKENHIEKKIDHLAKPQLRFNYLGQFDQAFNLPPLLAMARESKGFDFSPWGMRPYWLDLVLYIANNRLHCLWNYSVKIHSENTVQRLVDSFINNLQDIISYCQFPEIGGYTPPDFPDVELSQDELDNILSSI